MKLCTALLSLCSLLPLAHGAPQDELVLKGRRVLRGTVVEQTQDLVRFNPYGSSNERMSWGVEEFPAKQIKEVRDGRPSVERFRVELLANAESIEGLLELAAFCKKERLKEERKMVLEQALRLEPENEELIKLYGKSAATKFLRSDPGANEELATELEEYLTCDDGDERRARIPGLIKRYGLAWKPELFERAYRSSQQPEGRTDDKPLTLRGDEIKGVYTLFVPSSYDPFRPTPLVIGLHGGGAGGKNRDRVVGSGKAAMNFYRAHAERLGWIVACPTALAAPWRSSVNDPWIRALVDEMKLLFHVDVNRIYLTGHSMGGYGTWHFGPKYAEQWAAIGPLSGGGSNGYAKLKDTATFCYLYHGADDAVVGVGDSRRAAQGMLQGENDFVYTELPDSGHGFPSSIRDEMFGCFESKRRAVRGKSLSRPESSFLGKQSKEEKRYFGELLPKSKKPKAPKLKDLVAAVGRGGGAAENAAEQLLQLDDPDTVPSLVKLLKNRKAALDGRALAASLLGQLGDEAAIPALALASKEPDLQLFHACVEALGVLEGEGRSAALGEAVVALTLYFEKRKSGADSMSYSDWDPIVRELAFGVKAWSYAEGEESSSRAALLRDSVVKRVLLPKIEVPHSKRVRQDPERARAVLIEAVVDVLSSSDDEVAGPLLDSLRKRYAGTPHAHSFGTAGREPMTRVCISHRHQDEAL